jgi:biotin carboxylase
VESLAARLVEGIGFTHGRFNVEMRIDPADGQPRVIEINPRAAGQFYDLFERVDGYSLFDVLLDLECGDAPVVRRREGRDRHAASFVLRDLAGSGLSRWPSRSELAALRAANADAHLMLYPKRGADLRREMKWLGSYRYGVFNVGAASEAELFARFRRLCRQVTFHPHGRHAWEADFETAAAGD